MPSDHEYVRQRLAKVEQQLAHPEKALDYLGRRRRPYDDSYNFDLITLEVEARLLQKLLEQVQDGQAEKALKSWRRQLKKFLVEHRSRYKHMEEAHNAWLILPYFQRYTISEPSLPPKALFSDQQGTTWIVDESLLALLDEVASRLQKWIKNE